MYKVSVIIPTHNRAKFLDSAVTSVLNQTFQDFEIIIVDDASTDDTPQVVRQFKDERIKYIRHEANQGGSSTRNTGIANSSGEYIAFLDDDDEWLPKKLKLQVELMENSPPDVGGVYTGHTNIDSSSGKRVGVWIPQKRGNIFHELFTGNWVGTTSSVLLRKECFEKAGLFDKNLPSFQDYDMWIRISKLFEFEYIKEPLVKYSVHQNKISTNLDGIRQGMEIMLEKYGKYPGVRKNLGSGYLSLGVEYCYSKNTVKGRRAFLKAIRLYPFEIRCYFNLFLSLFGADYFKRLKKIKEEAVISIRG